jgi:predicted alpha/beta-hydrolase family hydrolase
MRTAHFSQLRTPSLFVSGTRDAFGTIAELQAAIKLIPAPTDLAPIEGGSHGLSKPGSAQAVADVVRTRFMDFFG